jgi:F420-dependent oxidoreductase-like protein
MKLSMTLNYAGGFEESARQAVALEQVGLDAVWVAEAYSFDAPSFMGFLAAKTERLEIGSAILPIYSRTPTLIAMTAAGVDAVSGGRCLLGLGASGPQVIEGFHGVPYDRPLTRTREIIEVCRQVWAREAPLVHEGAAYQIPLPPGEGTGLGKPLKLINHPVRPRIPIWVAALGEKNVAMTAEVADGWLPIFFFPEKVKEVFGPSLGAGAAKRDASLDTLQIAAGGILAIGEESEVAPIRDLGRGAAALYIGGMGAKGKNFYNALACRYGYEKEAAEIQDLYLSGNKKEAAALVPSELLEATSLCGPESYIKERVAAMAEVGVTHLNVTPVGPDPVAMIEKLRSWL